MSETTGGARGGRPVAGTRSGYRAFVAITTRWADNDVYGHVNNVVYYSFFDTAVNRWLIDRGVLDIRASPVIGLVAGTACDYFSAIAFPDRVTAGIRAAKIGRSSVRYEVGLFRGDADTASAQGHFVHVYVERATNRPVPLPEPMREALARIAATEGEPRGTDPPDALVGFAAPIAPRDPAG